MNPSLSNSSPKIYLNWRWRLQLDSNEQKYLAYIHREILINRQIRHVIYLHRRRWLVRGLSKALRKRRESLSFRAISIYLGAINAVLSEGTIRRQISFEFFFYLGQWKRGRTLRKRVDSSISSTTTSAPYGTLARNHEVPCEWNFYEVKPVGSRHHVVRLKLVSLVKRYRYSIRYGIYTRLIKYVIQNSLWVKSVIISNDIISHLGRSVLFAESGGH